MKLEIKHLAPYLPYRLNGYKISKPTFKYDPNIEEIIDLTISDIGVFLNKRYHMISCKPILRPLSDLTKEIEISGEKFVPYDRLKTIVSEEQWIKICDTISDEYNKVYDMPYWYVRQLHQWHFDTEGLIENKSAIDINTLNVSEQKAEASKV